MEWLGRRLKFLEREPWLMKLMRLSVVCADFPGGRETLLSVESSTVVLGPPRTRRNLGLEATSWNWSIGHETCSRPKLTLPIPISRAFPRASNRVHKLRNTSFLLIGGGILSAAICRSQKNNPAILGISKRVCRRCSYYWWLPLRYAIQFVASGRISNLRSRSSERSGCWSWFSTTDPQRL